MKKDSEQLLELPLSGNHETVKSKGNWKLSFYEAV